MKHGYTITKPLTSPHVLVLSATPNTTLELFLSLVPYRSHWFLLLSSMHVITRENNDLVDILFLIFTFYFREKKCGLPPTSPILIAVGESACFLWIDFVIVCPCFIKNYNSKIVFCIGFKQRRIVLCNDLCDQHLLRWQEVWDPAGSNLWLCQMCFSNAFFLFCRTSY